MKDRIWESTYIAKFPVLGTPTMAIPCNPILMRIANATIHGKHNMQVPYRFFIKGSTYQIASRHTPTSMPIGFTSVLH